MTYNWNTMVEITVPTGTNGWLYSGEVIINGVKVRFPVGVPTSVPEPAAVLLEKMIELEQEEDANAAKPQNHYVGDVTIPAGKTLTLEKGAKFVDNSGGSSGGGSGVCIVTVTADTENMSDFTNVKADKTFTEMRAAYESGGLLWCRLITIMNNLGTTAYECIHAATVLEATGDTMPQFVFRSVLIPTMSIAIKDDDTVWITNGE